MVLGDGAVVAVAVKELTHLVWRTFAEGHMALSEEGAVATKSTYGSSLTTTGVELTEGKHYWEVELLPENVGTIFIGISRPNLEPIGYYWERDCTVSDALYGNGTYGGDKAGGFKQGDRVGVMLDLDDGSLGYGILLKPRWGILLCQRRHGIFEGRVSMHDFTRIHH
jgi:hypothetical protein